MLPQFSRLGLLYTSCPNNTRELKRGRRLSLHQRLILRPTTVLTEAWICNTCNTVPSHNTRPGLRITMQEHEMLSGGITWLSSSASNYRIIKTGFFFLSYFQLKRLTDNEAFAWGRRERGVKMRCFSSEPASHTRSLNMGCPPGATAQWQQVYSRAHVTPPTRGQEHPALPRTAPKRGRALCAWGCSLLTTDIIKGGFAWRRDLSPHSFHVQAAAKCSCPQHCRPSCRT